MSPATSTTRLRRLLLSIHDVSPRFEDEVETLLDRVAASAGTDRLAMLVVPDYWGGAPIVAGSHFATKLRRWSEQGTEMFLHGWLHRDQAVHRGLSALKARWMTAGEGEFLGLSRSDARRAMVDGKQLLEDITGTPAAGFVAPAWLYSSGTMDAMRDVGFAIAEDHAHVWSPVADNVGLAAGPVITWASRTPVRLGSSLGAAAIMRHALVHQAVVRIAVHPGDLSSPTLLASIDRTVRTLVRSHEPSRYVDLMIDRGLQAGE